MGLYPDRTAKEWNDVADKITALLGMPGMPLNVKPDYNMTFSKDGERIGHMEWNSGVMKFTGNAEESAKVFFDWLKPMMDDYMKTVR